MRYAKAPVGKLRFKKPAEYPSWSGVEEATEFGQMCPQLMGDLLGRYNYYVLSSTLF